MNQTEINECGRMIIHCTVEALNEYSRYIISKEAHVRRSPAFVI